MLTPLFVLAATIGSASTVSGHPSPFVSSEVEKRDPSASGRFSTSLETNGGLVQTEGVQTAPAEVTLWRLDCGQVQVNQLNAFSDTLAYPGQSKTLASSCYLIRHGDSYMLWDTGLAEQLLGVTPSKTDAMSATLSKTIVTQLAQLGVKPDQISRVGISHYHFDHVGQAKDFPGATLYIGANDLEALKSGRPGVDPKPLAHWLTGGGNVEPVATDTDVFGDGSVTILTLPGHTPGHSGLLVRLKDKGPVLLSGDTAHFTENLERSGVPPFNTDRADSIASMDRFRRMGEALDATVIIQHEPADVAKLPAFPNGAD